MFYGSPSADTSVGSKQECLRHSHATSPYCARINKYNHVSPPLRTSGRTLGVTPDGRFFYQTAQHREAAATLLYAVCQRRGLALLLGRAGLGKTSVLFNLVQSLKDKAQTAYLAHPYFDRGTVLEAILASLGLESSGSPAQSHRLFWNYLLPPKAPEKPAS